MTYMKYYYGEEIDLRLAGTDYKNYSTSYENNPFTGEAWTDDEIDNLIGGICVWQNAYRPEYRPYCTQGYVLIQREGEADEILRPNANYYLGGINQYPAEGEMWDKVDDVVPDEDDTYIYATNWLGGIWGYLFYYTISIPGIPEVTTDPATNVDYYSATLNGTLDEDTGVACTCGFDYGLTQEYGTNVESEGTYNETESFDYDISGLVSGETYHFRAWAYNGENYGYGEDLTFTTLVDVQVPQIDIY